MVVGDRDVIDALRAALDDEPVRLAYLFGSLARGEAHPGSDVDLAVRSDGPLGLTESSALIGRLESALGRRVDLVDLHRAPPLLLHEVLSEGIPLIVRDPDEQADFETRAIARFLDTAHLRRIQHHYLQQRVEQRHAGQG